MKKTFFLSILALSCSNIKDKKQTISMLKMEKRDSIKLEESAGFSFRRNYSYSEEVYNNEKEIEKLDNRNPENNNKKSKTNKYYLGIKKLGFFDNNDNLILENWNKIKKFNKKGEVINFNNRKYFTYISYIDNGLFLLKINNVDGENLIEKKFKYDMPPDVNFLIKDLNKDNNDEIIFFYHWYIANGDNYDIKVYELKSN